jgi:NAD(P)-dependent dehydrogenase (short-subunit alcohol dehydrogenase family)
MNIFVTGGAGYIGSATAEALLNAGHGVTVYDSLVTGHRQAVPRGARFVEAAIEDRRAAARAACFLALVGLINVPIVHFAVQWWNTLHQGSTIRLIGPSTMDPSMLWPLLVTTIGSKFWFVGSLLQRARAMNLDLESGKDWARRTTEQLVHEN